MSVAYAQETAQAAAQGPMGALGSFMPIILIFGVFYFLIIRPQQKQQKELRQMIDDTKKGDEVVLASGLHGRVVEVKDDKIVLSVAPDVNMTFEKSSIQKIKGYSKDGAAAPALSAKSKKDSKKKAA